MQLQHGTFSQLTENNLLVDVKSTFTLDVLAHVLSTLKQPERGDKLNSEDLDENFFWMQYPQHQYQPDKFIKTVEALVNLDCFHLTKYGTDLDGNSLYRRDDIQWQTQ